MALRKIVNWEGGSNARYDVSQMTRNPDGTYSTDGYNFDSEGRPLSGGVPGDGPNQWTQGLPGARGGSSPNDMGGGGGGGGASIPGAGTYLEMQALANKAYNDAVASLKTQRRQRQIGAGLLDDWTVDPKAQYGLYHQMLSGQGFALDEAEANAMDRGLMGAGLGRQAERALRYGHSVENLGFKNQLSGWEQEFQSGMGRAEYDKAMAMLQAQQMAMANAGYGGGGYYDEGGDQPITAAPPQKAAGVDYARRVFRGSPATQYPGAASFGGGLGAALIAQKRKPNLKNTQTMYSQARGYVR